MPNSLLSGNAEIGTVTTCRSVPALSPGQPSVRTARGKAMCVVSKPYEPVHWPANRGGREGIRHVKSRPPSPSTFQTLLLGDFRNLRWHVVRKCFRLPIHLSAASRLEVKHARLITAHKTDGRASRKRHGKAGPRLGSLRFDGRERFRRQWRHNQPTRHFGGIDDDN